MGAIMARKFIMKCNFYVRFCLTDGFSEFCVMYSNLHGCLCINDVELLPKSTLTVAC